MLSLLQAEECPHRMVICPYCQLEVKEMDLDEHSAPCGSRTDVCDKCLQRVMLRYMEEHHKKYCGKPQPSYHQHHVRPQPVLPDYSELYSHQDSYSRPVLQEAVSERQHSPVFHHDHPAVNDGFLPPEPEERHPPLSEAGPVQSPPSGNPTMVIDQDWVGSVASACGGDRLDSMIAENMTYESSRRVARRDKGMLVREQG